MESIKEDVNDYVDNNGDPDYQEPAFDIYETLDLTEAEEIFGAADESHEKDSSFS